MSGKGQLRRIFKAAPHFPYQMLSSIVLIIAIPIFIFNGFEGYKSNWQLGNARPVSHSKIQDRIREKNTEYFLIMDYKYEVKGETHRYGMEYGFPSIKRAEEFIENQMNESNIPIWYSQSNPDKATMNEDVTEWKFYFVALIFIIPPLLYFRWIFLKYYELEIEE